MRHLTSSAHHALTILLGDRFTVSSETRQQHGTDKSWHASYLPEAVCFPESTHEVAAIAQICNTHNVPMIPYGAGTSVEGQTLATHGGLCIDLSRMHTIKAVHVADQDCIVEAGVRRADLDRRLQGSGLFFPCGPGVNATIGGMASTGASGTLAVGYGTMRDAVRGLTVVLADGRIIQTGGRARKSSAGYDLTHLFVGSEGTLGIITEVIVRLHPIPEATAAAVVSFPDLKATMETVFAIQRAGIPMARMELMDSVMMRAVNAYAGLSYTEQPTLFLEFHGTERSVEEQVTRVRNAAKAQGGSDFVWATEATERQRLWQARHDAYFASLALKPGCKGWSTDVCVPISHLAESILAAQADLLTSSILSPILGHVGDGNFHLLLLLDPDNPDEVAEAKRLNHRLIERAHAVGGTCTGEHGIGLGKREDLLAEHGPAVSVMRAIKTALDPDNLLNPGKLFLS